MKRALILLVAGAVVSGMAAFAAGAHSAKPQPAVTYQA